MAWKVYDFMEPSGYQRGGESYGPLPCKRWVREIPHKARKLSYRFKYSQRGNESAQNYNERHAVAYARWLAARDGIDLGERGPCVERSGFTGANGKWCNRIRGVNFSGRNLQTIFIPIPNWDWEPAEPVEEIIPDQLQLVPVAPAYRVPVRFLVSSSLATPALLAA